MREQGEFAVRGKVIRLTHRIACLVSLPLSLLSACRGEVAAPSVTVKVTGPVRLLAGESASLLASGSLAGGVTTELRSVSWRSSAPSVAQVTSAGVVNAVAPGVAEISAMSGGAVGTHLLSVDSGIVTIRGPRSIYLGDSARVEASVTDRTNGPLDGRLVTWQSSDPNVASVSSQGTITTNGLGSTVISASAAGASARLTLAVVAAAAVNVTGFAYLDVGDTSNFKSVARDSLGAVIAGREVTWRSSAPNVASVSATGHVTALSVGDAEITCTIAGRRGVLTLVVLNFYSDQKWNALNGWEITGNAANTFLTTLADSPFPDKGVLEYHFPIGMLGGGGGGTPGPGSANFTFKPQNRPTEVFFGVWVKVGSPYEPPPSTGQKLWYIQDAEGRSGRAGQMWVEFYGTPGARIPAERPHVVLGNQMISPPLLYHPNVTQTELKVGTWHHYEMYFKLPQTASSDDGVIRVWVDGVLNTSLANVPGLFFGNRAFDVIHQNMQWGGGGIIRQDQYIWATHNRVSGR